MNGKIWNQFKNLVLENVSKLIAFSISFQMVFANLLPLQVQAQTAPKPDPVRGALLELGVSGAPGANGASGYSFSTRARPAQEGIGFFMNSFWADTYGSFSDAMALFNGGGSDGSSGRNGGHAGPSRPGEDAGSMIIRLSADKPGTFSGVMIVDANLVYNNNRRSDKYTVQYGASGSPGRSASRHIPGGNGGTGGSGGDGGNATSGSDGGAGGKISISVHEKDAALFMLVKTNVKGGRGGEPGENGRGGEGGPGGSGGAAAMGSDTHYRTVDDGQGGTKQESYEESWFMPGGFDGSRGSSGIDGNAQVQKGRNGKDGSVEYVVQKEDGTVIRASEIYKLSLVDFNFDGMDGNGILEPGEKVTVSRITVRNDGKLPTPAFQKTKVYIAAKEWVMTDGKEIEIPRSLAPGETYVLDGEFKFTIKDTSINTEGARMVVGDRIEPMARIIEVNRHHEDFQLIRNFEITFPVEITAISGLRSLAPGEKTTVSLQIKNISTRDLGSQSELKRLIQYTLRSMGGNMDVSMLKLKLADGKEIPLSALGTTFGVNVLKAGDSFTIQGELEVKADAEPFTSHTVRASLALQHPQPEKHNVVTNIQNRDLKITAAQTFRPSMAPGILLITNSQTHADEAKAWRQLGAQLDLPVDIWDASYYGRLPLLEDVNGMSLAERYKGKTIVILDNKWDAS